MPKIRWGSTLNPVEVILNDFCSWINVPEGHSHWKGVWGCAAVMTPFFQASRSSLAHQFTLNAPLLCLLFSIFRKFLHFQPCFYQNSSSLDLNFSQFSFLRPPFFQENPLPRPYIFKPAWHTPTKKKVECPPPRINVRCMQRRVSECCHIEFSMPCSLDLFHFPPLNVQMMPL